MVAPYRARTGFANRPLALRRCLVEILRRRDRLTAHDMAAIAYARRIIVRPGIAGTSRPRNWSRRGVRFVPWSPRAGSRCCTATGTGSFSYWEKEAPVTDDIDEIIAEIEQLDRRRVTPTGKCGPGSKDQ